MKAFAIAGLLMILVLVPVANVSVVEYGRYLSDQKEADREAIDCANTVCLGGEMSDFEARQHYELSMQAALASLFTGSVGLVFLGLNISDLAKRPAA